MLENLEYLSGKPIAVLGGGSIGKACAADCALAGQKVNLCDMEPFAEKSLFGADRGVNIWGRQRNLFSFERSGTGKMNMVTTSIAQAVKDKADTITAYVVGDTLTPFEMTLGELTDEEREIILKGCLINYNRVG